MTNRALAWLPILGLLTGCCLEVSGREITDATTTGGRAPTSGGPLGTTGGTTSGGSTGGTTGGACPDTVPVNHRPVALSCDGGIYPPDAGQCEVDDDCPSGDAGLYVCACATERRDPFDANSCLPVACQVDSDCACGYCSPSLDPNCGVFIGLVGYYCHSSADTCTNDSECDAGGYCAFQPQPGHWDCRYGVCHSRRDTKRDIEYLGDDDLVTAEVALRKIPLARFNYKWDVPNERRRLGFIIEDVPPGPSVDAARGVVDLYGYTSLAVAALQEQGREIERLRHEVDALQRRLDGPEKLRAQRRAK